MPPAGGVKSCRSGKHERYFESTCDVLVRQMLKDGEVFDHNRAHELLAALKTRKPLAHCKLRCETKSLKIKRASTFGAQPPRKIYPYRDIERYYAFSLDSSILILGCCDEEHNCRYYEFIKLQPEHVNEVCDLLTRARSHPQYILTDETTNANQYSSSHSNLTASTELPQRPLDENKEMHEFRQPDLKQSTIDEEESVMATKLPNDAEHEDLVDNVNGSSYLEIIEPAVVASPCQSAPVGVQISEPNEHVDKNHLINETLLAEDKLYKKLCSNLEPDDLWAIDMKYIESHPDRGNRIAETGGVYLFIAHHRIPEPITNSANNHDAEANSSMESEVADVDNKPFSVKNTAEPEITMVYY